jgi:hypothetical protein
MKRWTTTRSRSHQTRMHEDEQLLEDNRIAENGLTATVKMMPTNSASSDQSE